MPSYFVFRLEEYRGPIPEQGVLVSLRLALGKERNWTSGLISDGEFACCLRVPDYRLGFILGGGVEPTVAVAAYPQRWWEGAWAGVVAAPKTEIRAALQEFVTKEPMVYSPVGGPFALGAPETRGSYVFAQVSEGNVDQWIELCKKAGIDLIHMIGWDASCGHYQPRKEAFPEGLASLERVVAKIHAAGLRAGLHFLFGVSPHDGYASPVPDRRLKVTRRFELAAPVDEKAEFLPTTSAPEGLPTVWAYMSRGNVVRVGDELVQYHALSSDPPGFAKCRRGVFGTRPASHETGAPVEHLYAIYELFYPDEESDLIEEIAGNIARIVNASRADLIYMDGAEGVPGGWYGVSRMRAEVFRRLEGRVMVEASEWGYHSWAFHSRTGAWDHPNWGLKRFVDLHVRANLEYQSASLLPAQLGWWAILGDSADHYSELPDELEYLCVKSLAWDMPISFQGITVGKSANGRQGEYLELLGRYERLRLEKAVPEKILHELRKEGQEFRLLSEPDGGWKFVPCEWLNERLELSGTEPARWHFMNRFGAQPLKLRLRVLGVAPPFADPRGMTLVEGGTEPSQVQAAGSVKGSWSWVPIEGGPVSSAAEFWAKNEAETSLGAWACAQFLFAEPKNLSQMGALGVWIYGDGSGQVINFQLSNPSYFWDTFAEHYVTVDFTGWKYFELHFKERDAHRHGDYRWPYGNYYAIYRNPLIRHSVDKLTIYQNQLPPQREVRCKIGPVRALPVEKVRVSQPRIVLRDQEVELPVTLETGHYVEWLGSSLLRHYDATGALVAEIPFKTVPPVVREGDNQLAVLCNLVGQPEGTEKSGKARLELWILLEDEPLRP
jgi:hypothetical protein